MNNIHDDKFRDLFIISAENLSHPASSDHTMKMITETYKRKKQANRRENIVMLSYMIFILLLSAALSFPADITRAFLQQSLVRLNFQPAGGADLTVYYQLVIGLVLLSLCFLGTYFAKVSTRGIAPK